MPVPSHSNFQNLLRQFSTLVHRFSSSICPGCVSPVSLLWQSHARSSQYTEMKKYSEPLVVTEISTRNFTGTFRWPAATASLFPLLQIIFRDFLTPHISRTNTKGLKKLLNIHSPNPKPAPRAYHHDPRHAPCGVPHENRPDGLLHGQRLQEARPCRRSLPTTSSKCIPFKVKGPQLIITQDNGL